MQRPACSSGGIYLLRFGVLREVLGEDAQRRSTHDLGREIFPGMLERSRVAAFPFVEGIAKVPAYWRDVGSIDAYWEDAHGWRFGCMYHDAKPWDHSRSLIEVGVL